jgi:hypothetical protein
MLRKLALTLTILATSVCTLNAQNAAKNWLFGRGARIDFNTSTPTSVSTINTTEGSSSISDSNGNLLFYTDGVTVWNKSNLPMTGGTGLMGNSSSTHSALIVPCNCDKYFIFTTDAAENQYANGLRYSVVDMTQSGGLGAVTSKNNLLLAKAAEKVAGVSDGQGGSWVVGHNMGDAQFYAYHIKAGNDCALNPSPQAATTKISKVGSVYSGGTGDYGQGQMKISPDGTKLAVTGLDYGNTSFVELFNFDKTTGQVSNYVAGGATVRDVNTEMFYGLEFSPTGNKLYVTTIFKNSKIYQYNILASGLSPRTLVKDYGGSVQDYHVGQLQLAPNGRIYVARPKRDATTGGVLQGETYLDALTTPDSGTGGFLSQALTLAAPSQNRLGLPTMVAGDFSCNSAPTPDVCCDKMRVSPYPNPPLNQDYRTFEIFNFKQPASPICSIDIDMQPAPHTVTWQGGMATWLNSSGASLVANFVFNYKRLPTTGNIAALSIPQTSPAVKFNLGFDNTQAYNGKTVLTVNHCDGTKCVLEYKPWIVNPPPPGGGSTGGLPWSVDIRELSAELVEVTLTYSGGGRGRTPTSRGARGAKWLGLRLLNESAEIYATDGAGGADGRRKNFDLSSSSKAANAALFEFNGLLTPDNREQVGRTITLIVRKKGGMKIEPGELRLTLYDENANPLSTGAPQP